MKSERDTAERADGVTLRSADETTEAFTLSQRRTSRTALFIETQEGDTVRLKIRTSESHQLAASQLDDGDRLVHELQIQDRRSTRINVLMKGDLNDQELASIRGVIEQAGILAAQFHDGDLESAFQAASALEIDGQQLARVGLKLRMHEQITYTQLGVRTPGAMPVDASTSQPPSASQPPPTAGGDGDPGTPGTTTGPVAGAPIASPGRDSALDEPMPMPTSESDVPRLQTEVAGPGGLPGSLSGTPGSTGSTTTDLDAAHGGATTATVSSFMQIISKFLNGLVEAFDEAQDLTGEPGTDVQMRASMSMTLKIQIFESVLIATSKTAPAENSADGLAGDASEDDEQSDAAVPALISETLDALAASRRPRLDTLA